MIRLARNLHLILLLLHHKLCRIDCSLDLSFEQFCVQKLASVGQQSCVHSYRGEASFADTDGDFIW